MPATTTEPLVSRRRSNESALRQEVSSRELRLAVRIRERIISRLGGRIHDLSVSVKDKLVVLGGRCATYYSKQLAQHAALGVLEDEHLENEIIVAVN